MRDYRKYEIWNLAMEIVMVAYSLSKEFPDNEKYNLTSQVRRSAVSIPSNIAEGCSRSTDKEF